MIQPAIGPGAKRVNQMVDIKDVPPDIKNLQDEREQRDAAKHHVREVAKERRDKQSHLCSMLAHFFLGSPFDPALEWSRGFSLRIENHKRSLSYFTIFDPLLTGFGRG